MFRSVSKLFVLQTSLLSRNRLSYAVRSMSLSSTTPSLISKSISNGFADVHLVPMLQDNYGFIVVDKSTNSCACVDPGDGSVIVKALEELELNLDMILCTHKHDDHVGGILELKRWFPSALVIGTQYESIPGLESPVGEGDYFQLGNLPVKVMHTPCHTSGHVSFVISAPDEAESDDELEQFDEVRYSEFGNRVKHPVCTDGSSTGTTTVSPVASESFAPMLFSGDTLFVGGCGRFFEGTAAQMLHNLNRFAALDPNTQVFCAHEYTEANFKFLSSVDSTVLSVYEEVKQARGAGRGTVPTTIGQELKHNLFMQCNDQRVQGIVGASSPVEALQKLRDMKNAF